MLYTAKHHIGLKQGHIYPGEAVENLDPETEAWLLANGAIEPVPGTEALAAEEAAGEPAETKPAGENAETKPAGENAETKPAGEEAAEEIAPAMTIDALDGIKPAKKTGRKKK